MKKILKNTLTLAAASVLTFGMTACSSDKNETDNDNNKKEIDITDANNLDYSSDYAEQWANYMVTVSSLLADDADMLYNEWKNGYADIFKKHNSEEYK
jgi:hypothetical protein